MLYGQFERTLDDKGRLLIPKQIKNALGNENVLYVLKGFEGSLAIYTKKDYEAFISQLQNFSYLNKDARNLLRLTLASVNELEIDSVGRITISTELLARYQINKDVVVLGVLDHIEIWDKEAYKNYEEENSSKYEELADKLVNGNE